MALAGSPGTWSSLALRMVQLIGTAIAFLFWESNPWYGEVILLRWYASILVIGMVWIFGALCFDVYARVVRRNQPWSRLVLSVFMVYDTMLFFAMFAYLFAAAGLAVFFYHDVKMCGHMPAVCLMLFRSVSIGILTVSLLMISAVVSFRTCASSFR